MLIRQVALVSQTHAAPLAEVVKVAAALQKQATRDFGPIWGVLATVNAFWKLSDVPLGYWPVVVRDDVIAKWEAAGIHLDQSGQPFALVQAADDWPLTASHEVLEMLADPFGERIVAGPAPPEAKKQKRVEYLVEVCDPSEEGKFGYTVNDIRVSDFYTPHFFDPVFSGGVRYSFTGAIKRPRTILRGGYISWHNTLNDHWYQLQWFDTPRPVVSDLGIFETSSKSTREWIDSKTVTPQMKRQSQVKVRGDSMFAAMSARAGTPEASDGRATMIEAHIARLLGKG